MNGKAWPASASLADDGEWFQITVPYGHITDSAEGVRWLSANAMLGGARLVIGSGRALELRAELAVLEELARRAQEVYDLVAGALGRLAVPMADPAGGLDPACSGESLGELLQGTGWPAMPRGTGEVAVSLEAGADQCAQATIAKDLRGRVTLRAPVSDWPEERLQQRAAAHFLLRAAGDLRLVCPALRDNRAEFYVRLAPEPSNDELHLALSALSVAARRCGRETQVLTEDPRAAATYLEARDLGTPNEEKEQST
jgi:hypothetical protein